MINIDNASLTQIITGIGGLGLASFALVDAWKSKAGGGISNEGFDAIEAAVRLFEPEAQPKEANVSGLADALLQTLNAHWINGMALPDQKAVAKSLIKLRLTQETAGRYAKVTDVDAAVLAEVAQLMASGEPLMEPSHSNTLGRFDLALTAILDAAYQRADQRYRNVTKRWAAIFSVLLAVAGGLALEASSPDGIRPLEPLLWALCGVLAVPLAPISKDLASALTAGVKVAQSLRR